MIKSKIQTYLGFCIRAGKMVFGAENVESKKKGVKLLVCDADLGKSSLKIVLQAKERFACPLLSVCDGTLGEILHRPGVKVVAITDNQLASAILSVVESEPQFKFYSGGNN
ncbi:MAG: hypothetical protein J6A38_03795 [Clostridia bacterium]|nr:hypothetical protein [Clostridia bacterium]